MQVELNAIKADVKIEFAIEPRKIAIAPRKVQTSASDLLYTDCIIYVQLLYTSHIWTLNMLSTFEVLHGNQPFGMKAAFTAYIQVDKDSIRLKKSTFSMQSNFNISGFLLKLHAG